ncbi:MAG: hypothetical protein JW827_01735 [Spirochaetes bacterium]|nr:hypothetical protein [Spirochaetota bacterium]
MFIDPVSITIHLDQKYKPSEVWNFILSPGLLKRFRPLYFFNAGEAPPVTDDEIVHKEYRAAVYTKKSSSYFNENELKSNSRTLCGSFRLHDKKNKKKMDFAHYLLPMITSGRNKKDLLLKWSDPEPAVCIDVKFHEYEASSIFYTGVTVSHGVWGFRHKWLNAMLQNIREMATKKCLSGQKSFISELSEETERMERIEKEILDHEESRLFFWSLAGKIIEKFTNPEKAVYVSPRITDSDTPYDLEAYRPGALPPEPLEIPDSIWNDLAWNECFRYDAPEVLRKGAKKYWIQHPDEERFLKMIKPSLSGRKQTWEDIVEIMTRREETERMILELASWTADINWPGAFHAWEHLVHTVGKRALPILDKEIRMAGKNREVFWEKVLKYIRSDISKEGIGS